MRARKHALKVIFQLSWLRELPMKGPYERLKYTLRRTWECPACSRRIQTDGTSTANVCDCQFGHPENERISMKLILDGIRRTQVAQPQPTPSPVADEPGSETTASPLSSGDDPSAAASSE